MGVVYINRYINRGSRRMAQEAKFGAEEAGKMGEITLKKR
jgi:hypothetical protein